jgi:RNA polymerase sigma factor (sigma-70 family)
LAQVSQLAISRLARWTIGQIFPGLSPELDLQTLDLPTRARNALVRGRFRTAGDLSALTLDDIIDWRQVGIGTVDILLRALADASTSLPTPSVVTARSGEQQELAFPPEAPRLPEWLVWMMEDISVIATWHTAIGLSSAPLLRRELPVGTPGDVVKARQRLEELTAAAVLNEDLLELDAAGLLDDALGGLDERARQVLALRLFADAPKTLDEIGAQFGVTRERVRQIEGKARAAMLDAVSGGQLETVASAARALIGTVRPLSDLLELMPALGHTVAKAGRPAWRVLDRLEDAYEIEDGWCVVPTLGAARAWTETQLRERASRYGVVQLQELDLVETSDPESSVQLTRRWLEDCGYLVDGSHVLTRTKSVGDYAAAILSIHGEPMSSQEVLDRFAYERSPGSLKNALAVDERFERVDRDRWALSEWGMDAYANIRSVIRREVANAGGAIDIDTLVERITGQYSVTASSVTAYASSPPFELRDGTVRPADMSRAARKPPERTARLYRRNGSWLYRVRVTHDHLRGSGSVAPVAITTILGMSFGDKIHLASALGDQAISWVGTQPQFGTIRRYMLQLDVAADTEVFLVMRDDRTFGVEVLDALSGNPVADALALVGASPDLRAEDARRALSAAIRLPEDSPIVSIIGAYRDRGDSDIADLLTTARRELETGEPVTPTSRSADVDQIMDLL